jgi:aryl-alcohol dehydrogenase-like predicted oxidoreductase
MQRTLGRTGASVSALGLGCWAIGGPLWDGSTAVGWGDVDDNASVAAIRRGIDLGVTFLDTADVYGAGHSERIVGRALRGVRSKVTIATKFGNTFDEATRRATGGDDSPAYAVRACEASLRRLETDHIDVYFLHLGGCEEEKALALRDTLENLVRQGKIRSYGWSTDDASRASLFAAGAHCSAIEHDENVLLDNPAVLRICEAQHVASVNRGPLAMGLLSGKYEHAGVPDPKDVRGTNSPGWMRYFHGGQPSPLFLKKIAAVREILTSGGRTLVQGALAWLWARSPVTIPIPGFRTARQVEENAGAMERGPLQPAQMREIERLLAAIGADPV